MMSLNKLCTSFRITLKPFILLKCITHDRIHPWLGHHRRLSRCNEEISGLGIFGFCVTTICRTNFKLSSIVLQLTGQCRGSTLNKTATTQRDKLMIYVTILTMFSVRFAQKVLFDLLKQVHNCHGQIPLDGEFYGLFNVNRAKLIIFNAITKLPLRIHMCHNSNAIANPEIVTISVLHHL